MIPFLIWIVGALLLVMAILDVKKRTMPSVLPTGIIFLTALVNFWSNRTNLIFGVLAFIFAWFLYEFDYFRGVADLKAVIIIGLMLTSFNQFYAFMFLTVVLGFAYQVILKKIMKVSENREIPFVPLFFIVYVVLNILIWIR